MEQTIQRIEVAELVKTLPMKLRTDIDVEVLKVALQEGVVRISDDGHWVWTLESKTLLAYFCGRLWCGDTPCYSRKTGAYVWRLGERNFPKKDLVKLFGVTNLRTLRKNKNFCTLPAGWEIIDKFFKVA